MVADIGNYAGREQAYVKHYFLAGYLESLVHKTASKFDEIAYVDGFSGPWQSRGENFEDTSFGIALAALRKAKVSWKEHSRDVRMSAYLIERSPTAYLNLESVKATFPDLAIHTYNADFITVVPKLSAEIPRDAFAFFFIDPKGWRFDIKQLAPLLSRQKSEVVFNFMFDFVNRAASISDPKIVSGLNELMPDGAWQKKLAALDKDSRNVSAQRKEILAEAFRETLRKLGDYEYVAEVSVLQRLKNRTLYSLFYGTRSVKGIEVFRDWHVKTERQQANVRGHTKRTYQETKTSQLSLFSSDVQLSRDDTAEQLEAERERAKQTLLRLIPSKPGMTTYEKVWPRVLERHVVTRPEVNSMAARMRKDGTLEFPNWKMGKRVPHDAYRVCRVASAEERPS